MPFLARAISPESASSSPVMIFSCVVFPAPLYPTSPTRSPFFTSQETPFSSVLFLNVL